MTKDMTGRRIADLQDSTPVADAARRVIALRLESVRDCLGRALRESENRRQNIHALRVATRRATAAVDIFRECLPRRIHKEVRGHLRSIRRAVGAARDWDVILQRLSKAAKKADDADRPTYDMLHGYALAHRIPAQHQLELACPDYPFGFDRLQARTVAAVRWRQDPQPSLGSFSRPLIGRLIDGFNGLAERGDGDWEMLHEVRIAGKRLRYSLEVVEDCFGSALEAQLTPALARLQEVLGGVNDSFNASRLLRQIVDGMADCVPGVADRYRDLMERQIEGHEERMRSGREDYRSWLEEWNGSEMQQALLAVCPELSVRAGWNSPITVPVPLDPAALGRTA